MRDVVSVTIVLALAALAGGCSPRSWCRGVFEGDAWHERAEKTPPPDLPPTYEEYERARTEPSAQRR
ncbi:hypothetical protein [Deferrisoma sp.]